MLHSRYGSGTEKYAIRPPRHYRALHVTTGHDNSRQGSISAEVVIPPTAPSAAEAVE